MTLMMPVMTMTMIFDTDDDRDDCSNDSDVTGGGDAEEGREGCDHPGDQCVGGQHAGGAVHS